MAYTFAKEMNAPTIRTLLMLPLLCLSARSSAEIVQYRCEIPEGLNKRIVLVGKDGTKFEINAHETYRSNYKVEWINAIKRHLAKGEVPLHLLFREDVQEWGIDTVSRTVGRLEAEAMISKASLIYPPEKLDELLRRLLEEEMESEQVGADQPATAPESKPEGKEEPQSESEGRSQ